MFCKYCGNEIADDSAFCSKCGKNANDFIGEDAANENDSANKTGGASIDEVVSETVENTNPLCIAGLVLTFVMFFFNYYCIVGLAAFFISFFGYRAAKKNGQKGMTLAVVCMLVSGIASIIFVGYFIEYKQYESAVYGGINGILDLLGL